MDNSREPLTRTRLYNRLCVFYPLSLPSLSALSIYQYYTPTIHIIYNYLPRASFDTRRRQTIAVVSITIIYYYITIIQVYIIIVLSLLI